MDMGQTITTLAALATVMGLIGGGIVQIVRLLWDDRDKKLDRLAKRADTLAQMADENEELTNTMSALRKRTREQDRELDALRKQNEEQGTQIAELRGALDYAALLDACFTSVEPDVAEAEALVEIGHAARPAVERIKDKVGGRPRRQPTSKGVQGDATLHGTSGD